MKLKSIREKDGNVIVEAQDSPRTRGHNTLFGTRLDLTDDYGDPRRGILIDVTRSQTPQRDNGPDFYVMDYNVTGYIPLGRRSTWAFNVLRSDAHVRRQGTIVERCLLSPTVCPDQTRADAAHRGCGAHEVSSCHAHVQGTSGNYPSTPGEG